MSSGGSGRRHGPLRTVILAAVFVMFGLVLGLGISRSLEPRMEGMPITGGGGDGMPGMRMPMPGPEAGDGRAARLRAAHADLEAGRFGEARRAYESLTREAPHDVAALIHLGESRVRGGEVAAGLAHLDEALAMEPNNLHALWSKAAALFDVQRDYAASIPIWERIVELAPSSPDAATARGYVVRARERLAARPGTR